MSRSSTDVAVPDAARGENAQRLTRRTVLGTGLALATLAGSAALGDDDATALGRREARAIDALLVDETIVMPGTLATYARRSARSLPVIGIQLDAVGYAGILRLLDRSQALVGISSGATLFCLERIAWDRGFRLTARTERHAGDAGANALRQDLAAYLGRQVPAGASALRLARTYRPSRVDAMLHAWVLRKPVRPRLPTDRREA